MALVSDATGASVTWLGWLAATCVPALILIAVSPFIIYKLNPPEGGNKKISTGEVAAKLSAMGKMSREERNCTIIVVIAVLVPVSITLAQALGFNVYTTGLLTIMAVTVGGNFLPFNSAPNMIFIAGGRYTVGHQLKTAVVLNIVACLLFILAIVVWFPLIGLL